MADPVPLFEVTKPRVGPGRLETAARTTIQALRDAGIMGAAHELSAVLVIDLARSVDTGLSEAKVSIATTHMIRCLMDLMDNLPSAEAGTDAFAELLAAVREARAS